MIERTNTLLKLAREQNTAVLAFICIDYNMAYSVVTAAEALNIPAILMLLPEHVDKYHTLNYKGFLHMSKELADSVHVPIGIHLDHSYTFPAIVNAIKCGFTSVMIDGSDHDLETNIALTQKTVEVAHLFHVDVEGEIGHVGSANEAQSTDNYTDPREAEIFCQKTKVDSLTVAVGNAHGNYIKEPELNMKRLEEISAATNIPLVLHGGSGIPVEQLKRAQKKGINKINIGTEFLTVYFDAVTQYTREMDTKNNPLKILDMAEYTQEKMREYLKNKMKITATEK